jgi:twinkle protein
MKIINKNTGKELDIQFNKIQGVERMLCPECSHLRKNKREKCFAWNHSEQIGFCHNCQNTYIVFKKLNVKDNFTKPEWTNNTELSDNAVKFFEARNISQFTLRKLKVTTGIEYMPQYEKEVDVIKFNYFRDNILINIKYRAKGNTFKLHAGSELIFYNLDSIKNLDTCYIVEGEIDCLTFYECGFHNVVSVPNGANTGSNNLQYLDNCWEYFENK